MKSRFMVTLAAALLGCVAPIWAADDGAALFKKCSPCHGANGEGKPAMKAPALKGTKLDEAQIVDHLLKGESTSKPPHNKGMAGLDEAKAKAIAAYVKSLK